MSVSAALAFAAIMIYIGSSPAIILEQWHLSETQFYYLFVPIIGGFMLASILAGRIAGHITRHRQLGIGFSFMLVGTALHLLSHTLLAHVPVLLIQVLLCITAIGAQLIFPLLSLTMIDMHPNARGAASSVQAFVALGTGAVVIGFVAPAVNGSLPRLALISFVGIVLALLSWRGGVALQRQQHP
jgi:DHA1 family bicyclomycin/chloramphenicol resistance-like MFS transporter